MRALCQPVWGKIHYQDSDLRRIHVHSVLAWFPHIGRYSFLLCLKIMSVCFLAPWVCVSITTSLWVVYMFSWVLSRSGVVFCDGLSLRFQHCLSSFLPLAESVEGLGVLCSNSCNTCSSRWISGIFRLRETGCDSHARRTWISQYVAFSVTCLMVQV